MTEIDQPNLPGVVLRAAGAEDTPVILQLIRELAEYERLSHEVVTDERELRENLFGERRVAEVVLAEHHGEAAGFALFFHNFSTFLGRPGIYLEDLFVRPSHRGAGIGRALITALGRIATRRGCGRVEWSVLDWNEPAIDFYRSLGARPMEEWTVYRVEGDGIDELAGAFPHD